MYSGFWLPGSLPVGPPPIHAQLSKEPFDISSHIIIRVSTLEDSFRCGQITLYLETEIVVVQGVIELPALGGSNEGNSENVWEFWWIFMHCLGWCHIMAPVVTNLFLGVTESVISYLNYLNLNLHDILILVRRIPRWYDKSKTPANVHTPRKK